MLFDARSPANLTASDRGRLRGVLRILACTSVAGIDAPYPSVRVTGTN
jgi:hypothetical protein